MAASNVSMFARRTHDDQSGRAVPRAWAPFVLVPIALLVIGASALFETASPRAAARGELGPISADGTRPVEVATPAGARGHRMRDIDLAFEFVADTIPPNANLFQTGPSESGLRAEFAAADNPNRSLSLLNSLTDNEFFVATLINRPEIGRRYSIRVVVSRGERITAWVDGDRQFSYSFPEPIIQPRLDDVVVGTGFDKSRPHSGVVENFRITYRNFEPAEDPPLARSILQLAGGALLAVALLWLTLRAATSQKVFDHITGRERAVEAPGAPPSSKTGLHRVVSAPAATGVILVAMGVAALAIATPPANVALRAAGNREIGPLDTAMGESRSFFLAREPLILAQAEALDVRSSVDVWIDDDAQPTDFSSVVLSTQAGNAGFGLHLSRSGRLSASIGQLALPNPLDLKLLRHFPTGRWVHIDVDLLRSRTFVFTVDGRQVRRYTFTEPNLAIAPQTLLLGGDQPGTSSFGGAVRDARLSIVAYDSVTPAHRGVLRLAQLLGALAIAAGILLLARAIQARLNRVDEPVARPLALTTFGTAAAGLVVNLAVAKLRFQEAPYPYFPRNSWLPLPVARFSDFTEVLGIFKSFRPYGDQLGSYPPFGYWLVAPFAWMSEYAALFTFLAASSGLLVLWLWRRVTAGLPSHERVAVVTITMLSYPVVFALDRANVDLLVFFMVALGITSLEQRRDALSGMWLGLATAAKIMPGLFLVVFARGRRLRFGVLSVAVALLISGAALISFHGSASENLSELSYGLSVVESTNDDGITATAGTTSITGWLRSVAYVVDGNDGARNMHHSLKPFALPLLALGALALAWYVVRAETVLWRAVTLATIAMLLLSDVSYDYRLIFLLVPLAMFLRDAEVASSTLRISCVFGLLLTPRVFFYVSDWLISSSVLVTAPLLITLGTLTIVDGAAERRALRRRRTVPGDDVRPSETVRLMTSEP